MSRDTGNSVRRSRTLERARVGWPRPLRELKDLLYKAYLEAGAPSLNEIALDIADVEAEDRAVTGAPSRDTVRRCISEPVLPPNQADAVSVAVVLARRAAWNEEDLAAQVRRLWVAAQMAAPAGRLVGDFDDRLVVEDLEVHASLYMGVADGRLGVLPTYVPRDLDAKLVEVAADAAAGQSGIAVLVGGSSTGKTRACWEAVKQLPEGWRLWHPIDPSHAEATLAGLGDVAPRTVVWLNEAQFYLMPQNLGEQVAASLRNLLREPERGPVLVLATLWPEHWDTLTSSTGLDAHAHARQLLNGHKIDVPDEFTDVDLAALADAFGFDPRLREAAESAQYNQITQYLAGVPALMDRYHGARGVTKALIHAAMDARRLGAGPRLPLAWLAKAAPGYLTDAEWNATGDDWLEQAFKYVTEPCNGIPGILTSVKTGTPRNRRNRRASPDSALHDQAAPGPLYQLADYLDQHGRRHRADQIPPIDFWTAAAQAQPTDLTELGDAAWNRGLYRDAAQLHKLATAQGDAYAACVLVRKLRILHPTKRHAAKWAATHVTMGKRIAVTSLLRLLWEMGAEEHLTALAERTAAHVSLDDPLEVAALLSTLRRIGAEEHLAVLLARDPATHITLKAQEQTALTWLLDELREAAAEEQVAALAARAAAHVSLDQHYGVGELMKKLRNLGVKEHLTALAERATAHVTLDEPVAVAWLLGALREVAEDERVAALAERAAPNIPIIDGYAMAQMLSALREAGAEEQVAVLLARDPATHVTVEDPHGVAWLLDALREAEAEEQVALLLARAPATHATLELPRPVAWLLDALREAEAEEQVAVLLARAPATHVAVNDPSAVAQLLSALRNAGAEDQAIALAKRAAAHGTLADPSAVARLLSELGAEEYLIALAERAAAHVAVNDPSAVAQLLSALRNAGAEDQAIALAKRAAAHGTPSKPRSVGELLSELRKIGAGEQATILAQRLPSAGCFDQFVEFSGQQERFRWGREPDGSPADPWSWGDLQ